MYLLRLSGTRINPNSDLKISFTFDRSKLSVPSVTVFDSKNRISLKKIIITFTHDEFELVRVDFKPLCTWCNSCMNRYVSMYVCKCTYIRMYVCMYVCMYVPMDMYVYILTMPTGLSLYVCMYRWKEDQSVGPESPCATRLRSGVQVGQRAGGGLRTRGGDLVSISRIRILPYFLPDRVQVQYMYYMFVCMYVCMYVCAVFFMYVYICVCMQGLRVCMYELCMSYVSMYVCNKT